MDLPLLINSFKIPTYNNWILWKYLHVKVTGSGFLKSMRLNFYRARRKRFPSYARKIYFVGGVYWLCAFFAKFLADFVIEILSFPHTHCSHTQSFWIGFRYLSRIDSLSDDQPKMSSSSDAMLSKGKRTREGLPCVCRQNVDKMWVSAADHTQ